MLFKICSIPFFLINQKQQGLFWLLCNNNPGDHAVDFRKLTDYQQAALNRGLIDLVIQ